MCSLPDVGYSIEEGGSRTKKFQQPEPRNSRSTNSKTADEAIHSKDAGDERATKDGPSRNESMVEVG